MKKLLATLLASTMALSAFGGLVACDKDKNTGGNDGNDVGTLPAVELNLSVWCPQAAITTYQGLVESFKAAHEEAAGWTVTFEGIGEADAAAAIRTDPEQGANIYFIASNQIGDQLQQDCLQPLVAPYDENVRIRDGAGAIESVERDGELYAFPSSNSNGYFLIYDKEFYTEQDVLSLDTMVEKAKASNKKIIFDYNNGFYNPTFFFGMDVSLGDSTAGGVDSISLDTEKGYEAGRTFLKYFGEGQNGAFAATGAGGNSAIATGFEGGTVVAGVSGTWVNEDNVLYNMAEGTTGWSMDRIGFTKLPSFTDTQGNSYQMGSFMGAKYCAVNPAKSEEEILASLALADYFSQEEAQLLRYVATGDAPSNIKAASDPRVLADPVLAGLIAQNGAGGHMQLDTPTDFWTALETFGNNVYDGITTADNINDAIDALAAAMRR